MQSNTYLYIIIVSILVGGFSGFLGYTQTEENRKVSQEIMKQKSKLTIEEKNVEDNKNKIEKLSLKHRNLQSKVRGREKDFRVHQGTQVLLADVHSQLERSSQFQKDKYQRLQGGIIDIQDQLQEDISDLDRDIERVESNHTREMDRLKERQGFIVNQNDKEKKENMKLKSQLETDIELNQNLLRQKNNLSPQYLKSPWVVGKVMSYIESENKIILNFGSAAGLKRNIKLHVFSSSLGGQRSYKGFCVVRDVDDMVSTAVMIEKRGVMTDPVRGDFVGSIIYKEQGLKFYLAGDFRYKYSKSELTDFINYYGGETVEDLTNEVDFFIQGNLADNDVPRATSLGITIIDEELFSTYLGE
ncbi:MAG: hypothetical protein HQL32_03755 [Planctomycetes bacterium]|nr:hypothetical protein [Planctomycetota bacterium]